MVRTHLLPRSFFERDAGIVARELLGKILLRREGRSRISGRIVETEAYLGADDAAAHAAAGETARNSVIFGPPGHAYVYFTYGMHYCMNVSCEPIGKAGCVLLRALEPLEGIELMQEVRGTDNVKLLAAGPARLCQALGITRSRDNGKDVLATTSDLQVVTDDYRVGKIRTATRIGISKSAELPLRFLIEGNAFVSRK